MEPFILLGLIVLGIGAGVLGALFGLGGGVLFVPVLLIVFGIGPTEAVAISLIGIVAGSIGASSVFIDKGLSNIRLGMLLEITTVVGAAIGAAIACYIDDWILMVVFCCIMVYSGIRMLLNPEKVIGPSDRTNGRFSFEYDDPANGEHIDYEVQNVKGGMAACVFAGMMSSMTGVGGGAIKVPVMNMYMHVPMKAASPTSSYMIGITAFSGAMVYLMSGQVMLDYAGGVAIGAFIGSLLGSYLARRLDTKSIRRYFSVVMFVMAAIVLLRTGGII